MPNIKIERFWPDDIKKNVKELIKYLEQKDFNTAKDFLSNILSVLKDKKRDGKSRVSVCFIIDQLKGIDPFIDPMVDALIETLKDEQDAHVREFSVWALGQIVQENLNLELVKQTMPIFIGFCNDFSIHVKKFAEDIKERLDAYLEEKKNLDQKIQSMLSNLSKLIQERINEMKERAKELSKEALALDYRSAYERRTEIEEKIKKFKELNAEAEDEILALRDKYANEIPSIRGESKGLIQHWRDARGEKEVLIRRVHCILRIQGKIYKIILHIQNKEDGKIDINKLKEETEYSDQEIIEILKKLVNEEIIPNFMLETLEKELQMKLESKNNQK